jgi:hypothetical protein
MKGKALYHYSVIDKHTGKIVGAYTTERGAINGALRLATEFNCPGRYTHKRR